VAEKKYGIAETFTSLQGEGLYAGTRMHFIRFSGCSVGKPLTDAERGEYLLATDPESQRAGLPVLTNMPKYQEKCTLYDGRNFMCDTNFQTAKAMSIMELIEEIPDGVERVCLTGGEPLDRDLNPLLDELQDRDIKIHLETSGTKLLTRSREIDWVAVAPKKDALWKMLDEADEIKLLVDEKFEVGILPMVIINHPLVWLQPVNYEWEINFENVKRCLKLIEQNPEWRLSTQMHKIWKVR
jgi:7-carboxy-7-deazaguanine synthase